MSLAGMPCKLNAAPKAAHDARHPAYALRVFRLLVTKTEQE